MQNDNRRIIGITGAVGSGKSSLLSLMEKKYDIRVIRADELGHEVYKKGSLGYEKIAGHFGKDIIKDGEIDRKKLGAMAFNNPDVLEWLNGLIHPYVRKRIEEEIEIFKTQEAFKYFFLESAILLEHGYEDICDEFWYIHVSEENRRKRLKEGRDYSDEKVDLILKNQMPEEFFRRKCQIIIDNDGNLENTLSQITHFLDPCMNNVI